MKFEFNRLDPVRARFNTSSVRSMYYIGEGEYWLGLLDFGLIRYNTRSGRIVSYREHPDLCVLPYTSTVNAIIRRNATSELCFATWSSGVWCYDEKRHRVRQINRNTLPLFADDCVLALREDPDGNLWIGSRSGIYIESASGQLSTLDIWLGRKTPFASTRIFDICCTGDGVVWIATNGDGIIRVDTKRRDWNQYRRGAGMRADNVYCLGTGRGRLPTDWRYIRLRRIVSRRSRHSPTSRKRGSPTLQGMRTAACGLRPTMPCSRSRPTKTVLPSISTPILLRQTCNRSSSTAMHRRVSNTDAWRSAVRTDCASLRATASSPTSRNFRSY